MVFDLADGDPTADGIYRIFEKYENLTPGRIESFKVQLGTGIGSAFKLAGDADGIFFTSRNGTTPISFDSPGDINLAAFFACIWSFW